MVKAYANNGMAQPISDTVQIERVSSVPNPTEVLGIRELQITNTSFVDLEPISLSVEGKYITATQIIVNSGSLYLAETDGVTPPTNNMSTEVAEGSIISLYTDPAKVFLKAKTATSDIVIKYLSGNKGAEIGSRAGSSTLLEQQTAELQAIKTAVQTIAAESDAATITGYIDSNGIRFLTRFDPTATQKTKHYRLDDGTAYSPVAPFELISSNVEVFNYVATAAGTGYSINDILVKFTDTETKSSAWRNETTNLAISSPISGTYGEIGKVGAATETKQDAQIIEAQTLNSNLGTKADSAASSDTGAFSLMSLIKRSLQDWTTFLNRMPSKGQDVAANSLPVVLPAAQITAMTPPTSVSVNNFPATQTISVASLPLPIGAATLAEQQTQTSAQQRIRDAVEKTATAPSGKTPVIGNFSPAEPPVIFQPISSAVFEPIAGRDFNIQVIFGAGVTGNVQLEQSLDGTNFYPPTGSGVAIMRFSSNAVEQWSNSEVGAKFRLSCTSVLGGNISYRISQ